ncbi:MAG TPA: DUF3606 domain-containing protein [Steroidobacteraceae bacterium]|nr:DUF3606 domain-containing protein [Steroidobacteraceae bacterium]
MSDDKSKVGSPDRDRINVHEVQHWSKKTGVSADELKKAVQARRPDGEGGGGSPQRRWPPVIDSYQLV